MLQYDMETGEVTAFAGEYAPGECACGCEDADVCCTFASYEDGSADGPMCSECCPNAPHRPPICLCGDTVTGQNADH